MRTSVVIVGGGVIGAACARWLALEHGAAVTVMERDPSYACASSALSASSIRQQFSTPVNIALSQASLELMRPWLAELAFVEAGYLYLARDAATLAALNPVQRAAGADIRLLDRAALRARWPWLALDDIALGSWGARGEGWFDGPALHLRLRREAIAHGARFVHADAVDFATQGERVSAVIDAQGVRHAADHLLIAAGAWSAPLAARLGVALPVSAKKRDVFVLESPAALPACPLLVDPSGVWLRPEGRAFLAGAPPRDGDPDDAPLAAIDHGLFDDLIWPALAARVPAFEALRVRSAWAGYYEMNAFDHNALVGALPGWANAHVACGFSGHGMQHAPAIGRGVASFIAAGHWGPIDLAPLSPARLRRNEPLVEANVI
ncbi:MAG TPA: FAD-binding oxidoreductase [Burkholderiaceae bacterium]|nr:FAD-binding oxidoreductase [Burkholderiaceae bacterium]